MLSQTVGYAINALRHLAGQGQAMFVRDLAAATQIPPSYLAKIVNTLARKGYLATQRGLNGGVSLARPAEAITLLKEVEGEDDAQRARLILRDAAGLGGCGGVRWELGGAAGDGLGGAGGDDVVVGPGLLEHQPHRFDVIAGKAPIAFGVQVSQIKFVLQSQFDRRCRPRDLARDESFAAPWRFVVKKNSIAGV